MVEPARPHLPALTSLRFVAALHVAFFHLGLMSVPLGPMWFERICSIGYVGVTFFFVLSGFVLAYTYAGRTVDARTFWRARFARIYPAYAFSLLLTLPFFFAASHGAKVSLENAFGAAHFGLASILVLALLQAWVPEAALSWNGVGWSLSVEAFFYVLFPALIATFAAWGRGRLALVVGAGWLATMAFSIAYALAHAGTFVSAATYGDAWLDAINFDPLLWLPVFALGIALGLTFARGGGDARLGTPLIAAGALAVVAVAEFSNALPYSVVHTALLAPAFAAIVYGFALRPAWCRFMDWKPLVFCGDASYSFYLLHFLFLYPFFHSVKGQLQNTSPLGIAIALLFALGMSSLVYVVLEKPARRWIVGKRSRGAADVPVHGAVEAAS